jgi:hypothetical protein
VGPLLRVHYKGIVEASMQGYMKGSVGPLIPVDYNDLVEASMQAVVRAVRASSFRSIIMSM